MVPCASRSRPTVCRLSERGAARSGSAACQSTGDKGCPLSIAMFKGYRWSGRSRPTSLEIDIVRIREARMILLTDLAAPTMDRSPTQVLRRLRALVEINPLLGAGAGETSAAQRWHEVVPPSRGVARRSACLFRDPGQPREARPRLAEASSAPTLRAARRLAAAQGYPSFSGRTSRPRLTIFADLATSWQGMPELAGCGPDRRRTSHCAAPLRWHSDRG